MELCVCQEQYGSQPIRRKYIRTEWGSIRTVDHSEKFTSITQFFRVSAKICTGLQKIGDQIRSVHFLCRFWDPNYNLYAPIRSRSDVKIPIYH